MEGAEHTVGAEITKGAEDTKGEEESPMSGAHLTSAAAFVEGGIQEACDDTCSICLEAFCDSDPSTLTSCKHEFHLQCILEWCQRSSQCPMCWQPISLKDPTSQELLEAVERERNHRLNPPRNATIFHHPTLGHFELQHLPVGVNDAELEERIIQHLAAAAAMGRRHIVRRQGQRNRSSSHGRPQFLVFSSHTNAPPAGPVSSSLSQREVEHVTAITLPAPSSPSSDVGEESSLRITSGSSDVQVDHASALAVGSVFPASQYGNSLNDRRSSNQSSPGSQDRAGPSEFQSFSESIKSKFNAVSMRYKESISKSTRGWRERFFSRNNTMAELGSEVRREVNAGIATVSHMVGRLDTRENGVTSSASVSDRDRVEDNSTAESNNQQSLEANSGSPETDANGSVQASCPASSAPS